MPDRILLTYATRFGSTLEVTEQICDTLNRRGFIVDMRPMYSVKSLDGYDAAVLGSAVNRGKWLPVAEYFVETYQKKLSAIPVALFSVHSTMLENDEVAIRKRQAILRNIRPLLHSTAEGYFPAQNNLRTGGQVLPGFVSWTAAYKAFLNYKDIRLWANSLFQMEFSRISTSLGQNEKPAE